MRCPIRGLQKIMYPSHLGKFNVPADDPEWAGKFTYTAEPPITVRSSMNPWETERQREIWLAEESAWNACLPLQASFRAEASTMRRLMNQYNGLVGALESLTGRPVGLQRMTGFSQRIPLVGGLVGGVMGLLDSLVGMLTGGLFGGGAKKKKKQAEELVRQLEAVQARMAAVQARMMALQSKIEGYLHTAEAIRATQPERARAAVEQTEQAYRSRKELDLLRSSVLRERIRQVALMPRTPGGYDAL